MLRRWHLHRNNLRNSRKGAQETLRSYVRCRKREDSPLALRNHCDGAQWQAGVSCEVGQRFSAPVPEPLNYLSHDAPLIPHPCIITSMPWFGSLRPWMASPRKFTQAQTCFLFWPYTLRLRTLPQMASFPTLQSCHTQPCHVCTLALTVYNLHSALYGSNSRLTGATIPRLSSSPN